MRPSLRNLGGHAQFAAYQAWFISLYCDEKRPIFDVLGRRVLFQTEPLLDDCAHVCYGGLAGQPYNEQYWNQMRAERIAWIELALAQPTRIHPDKDSLERHKYLVVLPPDPQTTQNTEFFCVIVRVFNKKTVAFLTAYYISQKVYQEYGNVAPRIWPPKEKKSKKR